ncbi:ABC transporter permease [Martelella alba]|uniref:ABC transporter permease n=1 Tax=Martelella alba TaxID=2590451 RepID=A0ABY2SJS6_9HYPH|nr:ABC transporter permease [Martelella alba]TKI05283.1 ABC transporter permease [Martelella alba]
MRDLRYSALTGGPWTVVLLAFFILPIVGLIYFSLTGHNAPFPSLTNYRLIFSAGSTRPEVLVRTIATACEVVGMSAMLAIPTAYFLAIVVRSARFQAVYLTLVSATFLVGSLVRTVSWRGILGRNGLLNEVMMSLHLIDTPVMSLLYGPLAVKLSMTYNAFPFMLFTLFLAMKAIDPGIILAARDLGANAATTFWRIIIPLSAPGLWSGGILVFVPTLSTVLEPEILGGTTGRLMATDIRDQFFHALNWPMGSALTVILILVGALSVAVISLVMAFGAWLCGTLGISLGHDGRPGR